MTPCNSLAATGGLPNHRTRKTFRFRMKGKDILPCLAS
nr:MAG TPA: hypothetical protein [Caudoviricetes sp.]